MPAKRRRPAEGQMGFFADLRDASGTLQAAVLERQGRNMTNYQARIETYLTHYQPELKAQLIQNEELQAYLETQVAAMAETQEQLITQAREQTPGLSQFQAEMEAERAVLEMYLTP